MKSCSSSIYRYVLLSLIVLCLVGSSSPERRKVDCTVYPFAKHCRGISAKRAATAAVPQSSTEDETRSSSDLDDLVLRSYLSSRSRALIKRSLLLESLQSPFTENQRQNSRRFESHTVKDLSWVQFLGTVFIDKWDTPLRHFIDTRKHHRHTAGTPQTDFIDTNTPQTDFMDTDTPQTDFIDDTPQTHRRQTL
ncbi:hypothetical protein Btru_074894 [Bulinus truncatus]|nr:hypothetical protein Btru_074894 [Bulinus truncatus]